MEVAETVDGAEVEVAEGWETRRRAASFRGIPLEVLGASRSGGRRLDVHEFGKRDRPWAEDMGRATRGFRVRGVVIGADHDLDAERLEAAFEQRGPGELVLPHRAPISVAVRSYSFEEPERQTRVQRFEVEFVEAGVAAIPGARPNTAGVVESRAEVAATAERERFAAVFTLTGETQAAIGRVAAVAEDAAGEVEAAFAKLKATAPTTEELAAVARSMDELAATVSGSLATPQAAAAHFQAALDEILALPFSPLELFRALETAAGFGGALSDPGTDTPSRSSRKRNQDALVAFVRESVTTARARALARVTFGSSTQAAELRDEIAAELAGAITAASDAFADDSAGRLRALRAATISDLDVRGARIPARVTYETPQTMPALLVAWRLYADVERDAEIVTRNAGRVNNPGRIPLSTALEVVGLE